MIHADQLILGVVGVAGTLVVDFLDGKAFVAEDIVTVLLDTAIGVIFGQQIAC